MAGGKDHVSQPATLGDASPLAGIEPGGRELVGKLGVFLGRDLLVVHHPFALAGDRIEPPMDEHADAGLAPPLHVGITEAKSRSANGVGVLLERGALLISQAGQIVAGSVHWPGVPSAEERKSSCAKW
jgi:hypothetical protein